MSKGLAVVCGFVLLIFVGFVATDVMFSFISGFQFRIYSDEQLRLLGSIDRHLEGLQRKSNLFFVGLLAGLLALFLQKFED